jgi:LAGLIDADG-like domain
LAGASRDGTYSPRHRTVRISQKGTGWLEVLGEVLTRLGARSWKYREGQRDVWTLETTWWDPVPATSHLDIAAYARGYFDAEGGIPRDSGARFYIQFVQKDREDLSSLRKGLEILDIRCGRLHNPSVRVDPDYWRFFVRASSHSQFCSTVGSWHPRKRALIDRRCFAAPTSDAYPRTLSLPNEREPQTVID